MYLYMDSIWESFGRLRRRLATGMESGLSALDALELTVPQMMALFRLVEHGALTISELQRATGRSQAATSHLVAQLERRGLVKRTSDPEDARRTRVVPTAKTRQRIEQIEGLRQKAFAEAMAKVPVKVRRQVDEALAALLSAMEENR